MADMLIGALAAVRDRRSSEDQRCRWARIAASLLAELPPAESTTAAVLSATTRCLDLPEVARTLVTAIWCVHGDEPNVAVWTSRLVERAVAEVHARTVVELAGLLVRMAGFGGALSVTTVDLLLAATADPRCHADLFDLAWQYDHRFGPAAPAWIKQILDDALVLDGARHVPRPTYRVCPACRVTPVWASGLMRSVEGRAR